ncbi:MAG: LPXTG cell wall anchor domain-containing protein [Clostridia bacterium]|nr:LPXTG cell wall anchor domain-containing protein [Clostridia bacterium]
MKKTIVKQSFIIMLIMIILGALMVPVRAVASNSGDNGKMVWIMDRDIGAFDIKGYANDVLKSTTFRDRGYNVELKVGDQQITDFYNMEPNEEKFGNISSGEYTDIGLKIKPSFVNNGNYIKIEYIVRNTTEENKTVSIATHSDCKIGGEDRAPLQYDNGTIIMSDGTSQFNIVTANAYGVVDTSTVWLGSYTSRYANMFENSTASVSGMDSGLAFSWKDRVIPANSSKTFSVLFGVGLANKAPILTVSSATEKIRRGIEGEVYNIVGTVTDYENSEGAKVYYSLDKGDPVECYTFTGAPGAFNINVSLNLTELSIGNHKMEFFVQDTDGAISQSVTKDLQIEEVKKNFEKDGVKFISEGGINTSNTFSVDTITKSEEDIKNIQNGLDNGKEVISIYDIYFKDEDNKVVDLGEGTYKIMIKLTEEFKNYENYKIGYLNSETGKIEEWFNTTIEGEYIVFTATHLAEYVVTGTPIKDETPKTGIEFNNGAMLAIGIISILSLGIIIREK